MNPALTATGINWGADAGARDEARDEAREAARAIQIGEEMDRERARREARRRLDVEERGPIVQPVIDTLRERLARPRTVVAFRIHGWQPQHSRVVLAAQFKAGKTTLTGNLARSLVDGDLFLGRDAVTPIDGAVAVLDFEMSELQLDDWLRDQGIRADDRVLVIPMRGRASAFDILDATCRAEWAQRLRRHGAVYLILDCLRPVLDALGLDEHRDAGRFLVAFDALMTEACIPEALVVHHMGHSGERSRGDSRLRDWPDAEWRLVRQDDNPASPRFITAYGRDVDVPESQLDFDATTRRLTVSGGSRHDATAAEALDAVLDVLAVALGPMSGRAVKAALKDGDHGRDTIDAALRLGVRLSAFTVDEHGPRGSKLYSRRVSECPAVSGQCPDGHLNTNESSVRVSGGPYRPRTVGRSEQSGQSGQVRSHDLI